MKKISNQNQNVISFWPISDFGLNEKRSRADPSRTENLSARLGPLTSDNISQLHLEFTKY